MNVPTKRWHDHSGGALASVGAYDVIDCVQCGFNHAIPIPSAEVLDRYYRDEFYAQEKPDYFERQRRDLDWWTMVYGERLERFERHLGHVGRLLDVGSGPGFFLEQAKRRGWATLGIEPSLHAAEHARSLGLDILNEKLDEGHVARLGRFDAIHSQGVIEHLADPSAFLHLCVELLEPNGLLSTIAANDFNPIQMLLREQTGIHPWWVVPPQHINYFSVESLQRLLSSHGLEVVHTTTTFPLDIFLLMGDMYVGNDEVGRACHIRRKNLEFALQKGGLGPLRAKLYETFAAHGIGRDMDVTARKPPP